MSTLADWSFGRVLLVSGGWFLLCVLVVAAWLVFEARSAFVGSGSGGLGAVSFGINVLTLLIPTGPPVILFIIWLLARWTRAS